MNGPCSSGAESPRTTIGEPVVAWRWAAGVVGTCGGLASPQPVSSAATSSGVVRWRRMPMQILGTLAAVVLLAFASPAHALTVYAATSLTKVLPAIDRDATY